MKRATTSTTVETKRVAVYTRQSVERENGGEFGSIEAQREAVLAYVQSQRSLGWTALDTRYDDRGVSGGTADRPALNRLLADVRAGNVDIVACYKLDRLSRSLFDFSRLIALFDEHDVAFVSVTQQFNSATSVGRLTLNLLGTFAQFEREQIAERTADKIRASRERGLWTGGKPMLGYDAVDGKLLVNESEAAKVREIFAIYLERTTLPKTLAELRARGTTNKAWTNGGGKRVGGKPFDVVTLGCLLRSPLYAGKIRAGEKLVAGLHAAIVDPQVYDEVQRRLDERRKIAAAGYAPLRPWGALLGGLVRCAKCGKTMGHTHSARGARKYRYYACATLQKRGAAACPGSRVPAHELEDFVVVKLKAVGTDPDLARRTIEAAHARMAERLEEIRVELRRIQDEMRRIEEREVDDVGTPGATGKLADLEAKAAALRAERASLSRHTRDDEAIATALASFDSIWEQLAPTDRRRIATLLLEKVVVDAVGGTVELILRDRTLQAAIATDGEAP
jgi:site-specific DNA recombinase